MSVERNTQADHPSHDSSIATGFIGRFPSSKIRLIDKLLDNAADTASFASQIAICLLLFSGYMSEKETLQDLTICLETLRRDWFDEAQIKRLNSCFSPQKPSLPRTSVPQLLQLLFEASAPDSVKDSYGRNLIARFLDESNPKMYNKSARIGILSFLVEKGVRVNQTCRDGLTSSMYGRYLGHWNEWCEALRRNNKDIEDVVKAEGNEWLLDKNWREEWRRRPCNDEYRCLEYSYDEDESEFEKEKEDEMSLSGLDDVNEEIETKAGEGTTDEEGITYEADMTDGKAMLHEDRCKDDA
jgi:hypothetical protein